MRFQGTESYVATEDLMVAVNAAITLERPLLVKGEPGTGKTILAHEIAKALGKNADHLAHQVDDQGADKVSTNTTPSRACATPSSATGAVHDIRQLHRARQALGSLRRGRTAGAPHRRDRQGGYRVSERPAARARPHGILRLRDARDRARHASGRSSSSPPTTRRSCRTRSCAAASSTISASPTARRWSASSTCIIPNVKAELVREALNVFYSVREVPGLKKKPSTSELLDWLKLLMAEEIGPEVLRAKRGRQGDPAALRRTSEERAGRAPVRAHRLPRPRRAAQLMPRRRAGGVRDSPCSRNSSSSFGRPICRSLARVPHARRGDQSGARRLQRRGFLLSLSRSALVKDERNLDKFDRVFGALLQGHRNPPDEPAEIPEEWLKKLAE